MMRGYRKDQEMAAGPGRQHSIPALVAALAALLSLSVPLSTSAGTMQPDFGSTSVATAPSAAAPSANSGKTLQAKGTPFQRLARNDQVIARALMDAQTIGRPGAAPWPLDRIAEARMASPDWQRVIAEMQAAGLLGRQDLRQLLQAYREGTAAALSSDVVITNGLGDQVGIAMHPREDVTTEMAPASGPPPTSSPPSDSTVTRENLYGTVFSGARGMAP